MRTKWIVMSMAILMLAASCKSKQLITKEISVSKESAEEVVAKTTQRQPKFDNAHVSKMSLILELNSRTVKVASNFKLITGEGMHISIMPALGIEMFKVEITPDSIYIFDKFNKQYYATSFQQLEKIIGVQLDYHSLESLLSNRLFVLGHKEIPLSKLRIGQTDGKQTLSYKSGDQIEVTTINNLYGIESVKIGSQNSKYKFIASYEDFALLDGLNFPQKIKINANNSQNYLRCDFSINRVAFNTNLSLQALDKSGYQKTDINKLLKK